jgi:hypothetical protein
MTKDEIQAIKTSGAKAGLRDALHSSLWRARQLSEKAEGEEYEYFETNMKEVETLIGNAKQIYKEMVAL